MVRKNVLIFILSVMLWTAMGFANFVYAEGWFRPFVTLREEFNDNVYLTTIDAQEDWITTISPGFEIKPPLNEKNNLTLNYRSDISYYQALEEENNDNHYAKLELDSKLNKYRLNLLNEFYYFRDPLGVEETSRIPRTYDHLTLTGTALFNRMELSLIYRYRMEDYRRDNAIGTFGGLSLTYKDLQRDEYEGEVELALNLWPKTALLFSTVYGTIKHDTGNKADSDYYEVYTGLRGKPTNKMTVEGKVGFRAQDYESYSDDYESLAFYGSLIEDFTTRDILRIDFVRRPYETNYQNNAYYEGTTLTTSYKHGFTERFFGLLDFTYSLSYYPTETTEGADTANRRDDYWAGGAGLSYETPKGFVYELKYQYRERDSKFSTFNYENNRIIASVYYSF